MKLLTIIYTSIAMTLISSSVFAKDDLSAPFKKAREQVISQYLADLQNADNKDIATLFTEDGIVMSTSHGKSIAKDFFNAFLPQVEHAKTILHQQFESEDQDHLGARFHLTLNMRDGQHSEGEYVDEFIFAENSTKLKAVYMFENLKFSQ